MGSHFQRPYAKVIRSRKLVHEENGGWHACTNGLRVARNAVESKLLTGIKAELSTPEYLEEFKRGVRQALADVRSAHNSQHTARLQCNCGAVYSTQTRVTDTAQGDSYQQVKTYTMPTWRRGRR